MAVTKRKMLTRAAGSRAAAKSRSARPSRKTAKTTRTAKATKTKWVYRFGGGKAEGRAGMRNLLGGKGAGLAEMSNLGLPVPPGFTITTEVCTHFYANGQTYPGDLAAQVEQGIKHIEAIVGAKFGDADNPLLVSVRSGARVSMPGMMDTVLNLGLNDVTVEGLARRASDPRFAYDSYRRFIQMYGHVVLGVEHHHFEELLELHKEDRGVSLDTELTAEDWKTLVAAYKAKVEEQLRRPFPQDPQEQLWGGIAAVFGSWNTQRAVTYRRLHGIPEDWGTAVNVQAMVFGNMGEDCATGVAFTRDPATGANLFFGEYLVNAQGEDVVAGIRTPQHLTIAGKRANKSSLPAMEEAMPRLYAELEKVRRKLEGHYRDMQDIEFTVQQGRLWMLQTRSGKRTAAAALKVAVDMVNEGLIDKREAVRRVDAASLDQLLHPTLDPKAPRTVIARGLPASPGAAAGRVAFTADEAEARATKGERVILVRVETSPEDIHGMHAAAGILTARGGMTSHAAVVARGMGRPCVSGASDLRIDAQARLMSVRGTSVKDGDMITIDGGTGEVMLGEVPTVQPDLSGDFANLMEWADAVRRLKVRTNAETPEDARTARRFGAEGIGLCRTEHMFFEGGRIVAMREMIMAEDAAGRRAALAKILPMQRDDFVELFRIMRGLPVTIRLLDPPLHEFLPHSATEMADVAKAAGVDLDTVRHRAAMLKETNPMLGHRGCRLGITFPEIYEMQVRAIFEAAAAVHKETGETVEPEVMIPLTAWSREFAIMKELVDRVADDVAREADFKTPYLVGTMIELPRAALRAYDIAEHAEFFSFGTNDLTQTTYGISRDDAGHFLVAYERAGILQQDPFVSLDVTGVGELVRIAAERGRRRRPRLKLGICGEHGGDPASIRFCAEVGLDYVSCSPYRVPIARLAAAQAALAAEKPQTKRPDQD
jgi:pyruvate,orthophosphate dikinase